MGHQANIVVIKDGSARIYYSSYGALCCAQTLLGGPEAARQSAKCLPEMGGLMPPHADGGYLLDFDTRTLVVIGATEPDSINSPELAWPDEDLSENTTAARIDRLFRYLTPDWRKWTLCYDHRNTQGFAAHMFIRGIPLCPMPFDDDESLVPSPIYVTGDIVYFQA